MPLLSLLCPVLISPYSFLSYYFWILEKAQPPFAINSANYLFFQLLFIFLELFLSGKVDLFRTGYYTLAGAAPGYYPHWRAWGITANPVNFYC